jgi:hypothetical protein
MRLTLGKLLLFLGLLALPACNATLMTQGELQDGVERAEWVIVEADAAWVNLDGATMVLERRFADVVEQRVSLPNHTTMSGDNFAHLRAVPRTDGHVFDLERALVQAGGLPAPFTQDDLGVMRSREDAAGTLAWTEWTDGAGTTCVLAFRRMTPAARVIPAQARALDMVLRNCSSDGAEAALAHAGPDAVAFSAPHGAARGGEVLTLSPLAAPMP